MNLAKADHPNIVGVHQVFEENNTAYIAMDFIQGRDLLDTMMEDPESLQPAVVEAYLTKVLGAVQHIHDLGILHRDIAPDNIIIDENDEPILIDFGAARESSCEDTTQMLTALVVVKDGYSPQEFYVSGGDQSESCDLYSLAASFYHIITGSLPAKSQTRIAACAADEDDPYIPLAARTDAYSKTFTDALDKALEVLPRNRMQSANEWLASLAGDPVAEAPASIASADPTAANLDVKPMLPWLGAAAVAASIAAGFFFLTGSNQSDTQTALITRDGQAAALGDTPRVTGATLPEAETGVEFFVAMQTSEPELESAGTPQPATDVAVEPLASPATGSVVTQSVPILPFTLSPWEPGRIVDASDDSPDWLTTDIRIVSVNGKEFETSQQIKDELEEIASLTEGFSFDVTLGIDAGKDGIIEKTHTFSEECHTMLVNGLRFISRDDGTGWKTEVLEAPEASPLEVGDTLVSYVATWEDLTEPMSLSTILERELANGKSDFSFSINRNGETWLETFTLATLSQ